MEAEGFAGGWGVRRSRRQAREEVGSDNGRPGRPNKELPLTLGNYCWP